MEKDDLIEELSVFSFITVKNIDDVNHKPHQFVAGVKHIEHASVNCGGILGERTMNEIPSYSPNGRGLTSPPVFMKDITFDTVCFIQLTCNVSHEEFSKIVPTLEKYESIVDGIVLIDTPEKFRIEGEEDGK